MRGFALVVAVSIVGVSPAVSAEILQPSSKWQVDYGNKKCLAGRVFGTGNDAVTLLLEQHAPADGFRINLIGQRFRGWSEDRTTKLRFGPANPWQDLNFFAGNYGKDKPAIFTRGTMRLVPYTADQLAAWRKNEAFEYTPVTDAQRAAVQSIDIKRGSELQLMVGRLDRLTAEMSKCTGQIVKSWGFDPAVMASLKSGPKPSSAPGRWIVSGDYPATATFRGQRALVSVRLNVDEKGAVTACEILASTKPKEFEDAVCRALVKRARFEPAIGPDNKPAAAYWNTNVVFAI